VLPALSPYLTFDKERRTTIVQNTVAEKYSFGDFIIIWFAVKNQPKQPRRKMLWQSAFALE